MFYNFTQFANVVNGVLNRKEVDIDIKVGKFNINIDRIINTDVYTITFLDVNSSTTLRLHVDKKYYLIRKDVMLLTSLFDVRIGREYFRFKSITNIIYLIYYYAKNNNILPSDIKTYIVSSYYNEKYKG